MANILVIDDSPTVAGAVREALAPDGHQVESLKRFIDLPAVIATRPPDLILLDLEIPSLSGVALGGFVRRYQRRHIHILIHSSLPESTLAEAAAQVGALGYLSKGTPWEAMRAKIRHALAQS